MILALIVCERYAAHKLVTSQALAVTPVILDTPYAHFIHVSSNKSMRKQNQVPMGDVLTHTTEANWEPIFSAH